MVVEFAKYRVICKWFIIPYCVGLVDPSAGITYGDDISDSKHSKSAEIKSWTVACVWRTDM